MPPRGGGGWTEESTHARALVALAAAVTFPVIAMAQAPKQVEVTNFPNPQNVAGSVEVSNLPAVQDVNVVGGASGDCPAPFQLVGFTAATFTGGQGVLGFSRACQVEFLGSRMCTSTEVMETTTIPSGLTGEAWVRPSFSPVASGVDRTALDASGVSNDFQLFSCRGWNASDVSSFGLGVNATGGFRLLTCITPQAVACCAPLP